MHTLKVIGVNIIISIISLLKLIMKYKKHLATGALALSLLVSGSTIYAATPQDLGIKNVPKTYQKQNKTNPKTIGLNKQNGVVGVVSALTSTGFTVNVTYMKTKATSSVDVVTNATTTYKKDGLVYQQQLSVGTSVDG